MKKSRKNFLGMSQKQIAILSGFSFLVIVMIASLMFLVISNLSVPRSAQSAASQVIASATALPATATVSLAPEFTDTPEIALTPTLALPADPPAGWIKFETAGAELWLPNSFVGGDMTTKRNESIQKVNELGKRFANVVTSMKAADKNIVLFAADKNITHTVIREVTLEYVPVPEETLLKDYIDAAYVSEGGLAIVIYENKIMTLLGLETRRLTYQSRQTSGLEGTVIEYALKDGPGIWFVAYIFPPDQILDIMPMVEQSIATFNIIK
ncbi:MAG: hypothetical protein L6461_05970 [Anaerolineae bacterium]|nr:hypothetical protein [Anaerolineae bacterium]